MNEYVLVEFIANGVDRDKLHQRLIALGEDFKFISAVDGCGCNLDEDVHFSDVFIFKGQISSIYASAVKLQDAFLAERMRISYIPNDLKDKYRRK